MCKLLYNLNELQYLEFLVCPNKNQGSWRHTILGLGSGLNYLFSKTKALNSGVVTAKLICVFVLHIQNQGGSFDHNTFSPNNNIYVTHITFYRYRSLAIKSILRVQETKYKYIVITTFTIINDNYKIN